jgi:cell fate (sporulation/competence/biofilm development) regulator YmcA (YheA/YmcA/DUF963 family)
MTDPIAEKLFALTEAMKEDSDYIRYLQLEEELKRDQELKKKVDEFRLRNFYLQESDVDLYDAVDDMDREFRELRKIPIVNAYLDAELSVCRMIQRVMGTISREIRITAPEM